MAEPILTDFSDPVQRDAFGHWLSGFVDGEGSFNVGYHIPRGGKTTLFVTHLAIELRSDDLEILEEIKKYFGCGQPISFREFKNSSCQTARLQFFRSDEIVNSIIPHFDRYPLRAKKRRDYLIFREASLLRYQVSLRKCRHKGLNMGYAKKWNFDEIEHFKSLADKLRKTRRFDSAVALTNVRPEEKDPQSRLNFRDWGG